MSVRLYMDHNVKRDVTDGLRLKGVDVVTAFEDGADRLPDPDVLDRAMALGRALFSHDSDMPREATRRQRKGERFGGVIFSSQVDSTIGQSISNLALVAEVYEDADMTNRVEFLPL